MLRPFQENLKKQVLAAWQEGQKNVLVKSATGSGKTVVLADIVRTLNVPTAIIAHRGELVSQISTALAREGLRHRVIGADGTRRACVSLHTAEFGRSFVDPRARVAVCSVDTLVNREHDGWFNDVQLWVQDEAHHVLQDNKWGKAAAMFPNARGLGVTATPARADGKGLGRHADGLFDAMVEGPSMRELINAGYLTDYRVVCPPSDVDYSQVPVTPTGDLSGPKLRKAVHSSNTIVGDVVKHYCKLAQGKLGVTFAVDVEAAQELAEAYRRAGVPAEVVTAKTPDTVRADILRRFARREILQLVNVDLFGEGFDLPAIEVVSMVRKTESWPLYVQQFGRALRLMISPEHAKGWGSYSDEQRRAIIAASPKPRALIIDHVGNVVRHGLPDKVKYETLNRRERRGGNAPSDAEPVRVCLNEACLHVYPRALKGCPFCGFTPAPVSRSAPEFVEGDLVELDAAVLARMRGEVARIDAAPRIPQHLDPIAARSLVNKHLARQQAQAVLRGAIAQWAGIHKAEGREDSEIYRRFWHAFGTDVLSAQALGKTEAEALTERITTAMGTINATS